jgi:hypothetical protein
LNFWLCLPEVCRAVYITATDSLSRGKKPDSGLKGVNMVI